MIQKKTPDPTKAESSAPNIAQFIATREEFNALRSAYAQQGHNLHSHKKSLVTQREVGLDTLSYDEALRRAMREAPNLTVS